ncbi:helix-turn-helix domain-containing protein [Haloplanus halophilus]|uniref:helix-turn-helix domain-containing protein n=1 Tax=Haloplanus halophilus TaxID=2949993 RepID=UPI00203DB22C|nr:helix-turn-helix domain-containing protein [Haloplanus sp. GDY1]
MGSGIRAELKVDADGTCPVAGAAADAGSPTFSVSKGLDPEASGHVTEEFMLEDADVDSVPDADVDPVFTYGSKTVYRFSRPRGQGCPCECVEAFDCPVVDVHTRDGMLYLVFHAADMDELQGVITTLREEFPTVDIRRLLRSRGDPSDHDLVFVDRGRLTARQREVLERAHEMGYFDHPKGANAGEVADALDISRSTFSEHLGAAQTKLLDAVLEK